MTWSKVVQDQKSDWCPILIPILVLIISIYLVIAPIVDNPQIEYLYSILFLVFGAIMYAHSSTSADATNSSTLWPSRLRRLVWLKVTLYLSTNLSKGWFKNPLKYLWRGWQRWYHHPKADKHHCWTNKCTISSDSGTLLSNSSGQI